MKSVKKQSKTIAHLSLYVAIVIALSGCAAMSEKECLTADWQAIGFEEGAKGHDASGFERFRKSCAKHTVTADFNRFLAGHNKGLDQYCTFDSGLALGQQGKTYNTVCSRQTYPSFDDGHRAGVYQYCDYNTGYERGLNGYDANPICPARTFTSYARGYERGAEKYAIQEKIDHLESDLNDIGLKLERIKKEIKKTEDILVGENTTAAARKAALKDNRHYKSRYHTLDNEYHDIEESIEYYEREYESL